MGLGQHEQSSRLVQDPYGLAGALGARPMAVELPSEEPSPSMTAFPHSLLSACGGLTTQLQPQSHTNLAQPLAGGLPMDLQRCPEDLLSSFSKPTSPQTEEHMMTEAHKQGQVEHSMGSERNVPLTLSTAFPGSIDLNSFQGSYVPPAEPALMPHDRPGGTPAAPAGQLGTHLAELAGAPVDHIGECTRVMRQHQHQHQHQREMVMAAVSQRRFESALLRTNVMAAAVLNPMYRMEVPASMRSPWSNTQSQWGSPAMGMPPSHRRVDLNDDPHIDDTDYQETKLDALRWLLGQPR
ncbi:hypothetical protein CYMTET_8729 [Cymbomonas tetramitiformis]|uniref:Uncharacterized protein n=1 Tax=Cymbomonas tetramitiformis TaxID=36881 RepID=A0AAE0GUB7_9CHLO|nr:hypothetical protein CYMTET_8729 [Cymbomonas tetramitiformis]